jgi:hypothetical protein
MALGQQIHQGCWIGIGCQQAVEDPADGQFQSEVLERGLIKEAFDVIQAMVGLGSPVRHGRSCGFALNEH